MATRQDLNILLTYQHSQKNLPAKSSAPQVSPAAAKHLTASPGPALTGNLFGFIL